MNIVTPEQVQEAQAARNAEAEKRLKLSELEKLTGEIAARLLKSDLAVEQGIELDLGYPSSKEVLADAIAPFLPFWQVRWSDCSRGDVPNIFCSPAKATFKPR